MEVGRPPRDGQIVVQHRPRAVWRVAFAQMEWDRRVWVREGLHRVPAAYGQDPLIRAAAALNSRERPQGRRRR